MLQKKSARKRVYGLLSRALLRSLKLYAQKENGSLDGFITRHFLIVFRLSIISILFFFFFRCYPFFCVCLLSRAPHGVEKFARVFTGVVEVIRRPLLS